MLQRTEINLGEAPCDEGVQFPPLKENLDGGKPQKTSEGEEKLKKKPASGNDRLRVQHQEVIAGMQAKLLTLTQVVGEQQETLVLNKKAVGDVLNYIVRLSLASEAMQLAVNLLTGDDPAITEHTLDALQQLRRRTGKWERNSLGWFELRYVNGNGPYLYHRYRGEDGKKYTQYYGRLEKLQDQVEIDNVDTTHPD